MKFNTCPNSSESHNTKQHYKNKQINTLYISPDLLQHLPSMTPLPIETCCQPGPLLCLLMGTHARPKISEIGGIFPDTETLMRKMLKKGKFSKQSPRNLIKRVSQKPGSKGSNQSSYPGSYHQWFQVLTVSQNCSQMSKRKILFTHQSGHQWGGIPGYLPAASGVLNFGLKSTFFRICCYKVT